MTCCATIEIARSGLSRPPHGCRPEVDPASPLQFVINAAAGSSDADAKREVIETALRASGRSGDLLFSRPAALAFVAQQAANRAIATCTAVVAVGGDGTLNTVAQAAHAMGCAMGVVPQGTFNYFARTHGIPADPAEATRLLLGWTPLPVQVAAVNDRVFLVNASLGLLRPTLAPGRRGVKVAFDGEVTRMRAPLDFRVLAKPLYLLMPRS